MTSEEIKRKLWSGANDLRGSMDASRYKDYMLGLMFYKFLSDKTLESFKNLGGSKNVGQSLVEEYESKVKKHGDELFTTIRKNLGYYVEPKYLYQTWLNDINNGAFELQKVTDSLNSFERTIVSDKSLNEFKGLFSSSKVTSALFLTKS